MTFLSDSTDWLASKLQQAAGQSVSIRRNTSTTAGVTAVADSIDYTVTDTEGMITRVRFRDFWIAIADYKINSVAVNPVSGDRIIDADGRHWEVSPVGMTDAFAEWDSKTWLLHTKKVSG